MTKPILYSFRRCPYAMRARLVLAAYGVKCELREVVLKDKPDSMLKYSPKGSVPVMVLDNDVVIDESLDVMDWGMAQADKDIILPVSVEQNALIAEYDDRFVHHLSRYKYADWHEGVDPIEHRDAGLKYLERLDDMLEGQRWLYGDKPSKADYAILPFVRQFRIPDEKWFDALPVENVKRWLGDFLRDPLFKSVMIKYDQWEEGTEGIAFPATI